MKMDKNTLFIHNINMEYLLIDRLEKYVALPVILNDPYTQNQQCLVGQLEQLQ